MNNSRLRIFIYLIIALVSPLVLHYTAPFAFDSWSQYAKHWNEIFLDITLVFSGLIYYEASLTFKQRYDDLFKLKPRWLFGYKWFRIEHLYRATGFAFFGILFTDVNESYLEVAHFIMTGTAIGLVYLGMMLDKNVLSKVAANLGLIGFLIGFLTEFYRTFEGEWLMMAPAAVYMYVKNKKQ